MTKQNQLEVNDQKLLRVLMVEDSEDDVLLTIRELKKGGYNPVYERVETAAAMKKAIQEKQWDIILCDYKMPKFDAPSAIAVLKEVNVDIPIIIISGTIGEDVAIECMRLGAQDYIMKGNLSRLCPAIDRELKEAEVRNKQRQAEEALRERDIQLKKLASWAPGMMYQFTKKPDGTYCVPFTTEAIKDLFGCSQEDVRENFSPIARVILPEDLDKVFGSIEYSAKHLTIWTCEYRVQIPGQSIRWILGKSTPEKLADGSITWYGFNTDITETKKVEEALRESEKKYRLLADHVDDVIFVLDMNLNYTYISPSVKNMRGYEPEEVLKQQSMETLTPSSRDLAMKTFAEIMEQEKIEHIDSSQSWTLQLEMRRKDGSTVWTEVKLSFIRNENQQPVGILGVNRDISERKRTEDKLLLTLESLKKAVATTIQVLVSALEARDPYTAGHQSRSAHLACAIAAEMGLAQEKIEGIRMAGSIHDIGKLSIPAEILSKPSKLTEIEFSLIKEHSRSGYEMLKDVESPWPLAEIVRQHHERINGSGYPENLKGDEIIIEARIMAVADVVEAMASHRPYRPGLGIDAALEEIEKNKGILYDNDVADACLRLFREKNYTLTV